jgi:hypothetical protein
MYVLRTHSASAQLTIARAARTEVTVALEQHLVRFVCQVIITRCLTQLACLARLASTPSRARLERKIAFSARVVFSAKETLGIANLAKPERSLPLTGRAAFLVVQVNSP